MRKAKGPIPNGTEIHPGNITGTEKNSRGILDLLLEGIQVIDFNWCYVYVNKTLAGYEQTNKENLLGHSILKRYPGIERTEFFAELKVCMVERKSQHVELEFVYPGQSPKWLQLSIEPVEEGILVLSMDISKRQEAEERMKRSNQLYSFISQVNQKIVRVKDEAILFSNACRMALDFGKFNGAWIGIFDSNSPQKISIVEHSGIPGEDIKQFGEATLGFSFPQAHVLHSGTYYICNDIEQDPVMEAWRPYASQYGIRSCVVLPIRKSDKIIGTFNLYSAERDFSSEEELALLVEVTGDISFALDLFETEKLVHEHRQKRQRAEEKLILKNEELQKTNSELDRFVYSASHDLRAPLSSVLGLITLIELESKETETLAYSKLIRSSVNRLEGFIRNILSYSKNNRLELEVVNIPIRKTIEAIVDSLRNSKEAAGITFIVDIDEELRFYSDTQRLTIILENLVSNAIKFQNYKHQKRIISITGKVDRYNLAIKVSDNGIGIAEEYQSKIFDMFFRISGERDGSGIGLYIVKETVTKLHGTISVDSDGRTGTAFSVHLKNLAPSLLR